MSPGHCGLGERVTVPGAGLARLSFERGVLGSILTAVSADIPYGQGCPSATQGPSDL